MEKEDWLQQLLPQKPFRPALLDDEVAVKIDDLSALNFLVQELLEQLDYHEHSSALIDEINLAVELQSRIDRVIQSSDQRLNDNGPEK